MKKLLLLTFCISSVTAIAQTPALQWVKTIDVGATIYTSNIAADVAGNVYTIGTFSNTTDFDPGPGVYNLTPNGGWEIYISKLDAAGNFVWARSLGGTQHDYGYSIAVDAAQNVYTTGFFSYGGDFNPDTSATAQYWLTTRGYANAFISKLDAAGNFVWAKNIGSYSISSGTGYSYGTSIAVDAASNVYTCGYFLGTYDFDPNGGTYNLTSDSTDIFISKLNAAGNFVWAKKMGGQLHDEADAIKVKAGYIYTTGNFEGNADFDPGAGTSTLTAADGADVFVTKLDTAGNFIWAKGMPGANIATGNSIDVDGSGNVYTTGSFLGTTDLTRVQVLIRL